jgi:two-component system phosphate regulon sensor histidine kinase PhoR
VSNLSHELRTPLSVIALVAGNLDRLYDRLSNEKRRKLIRDMREHAQLLDDLIGDVLEISRIDSGRISSERQPVDLAQLTREESEKQQPLAERRRQTIEVTGANALPVEGNREQLRMIIRNLLNNAIKYTPPGGHVKCHCRIVTPWTGSTQGADLAEEETWPGRDELEAGRWAALCVEDTGVGISPQDLPRIYERFYRVKSESHVPGTGLGLSITKELTEAHGGHIAATSVPGVGSSFAVYLPLVEE